MKLKHLGITAVLAFCGTALATALLVEVPMVYVPSLNAQNDIVMSNGFRPHRGFQGTGYRLEPLHRNHSPMDYRAWHDESWDQLRVLYGAAWDWPREMTEAKNADDLETIHYNYFLSQQWISFTVLTPDGSDVIGSLYITPETCGAYDAMIQYWISTPDRAVEATFHAETKMWLNTVWPYRNVFYPGPEMTDEQRGQAYVGMNSKNCL